MTRFYTYSIVLVALILSACGSAPIEPTAPPTITPFPTTEPQPTRTPFGATSNSAPTTTPLFNSNGAGNTTNSASAPTAILPATVSTGGSASASGDTLLSNGRGLTTGRTVTNGEFEVEGYCNILNNQYGVSEDGTDWYCTFNEQRALTLRQEQFNDICQRTYSNLNAVAIQVNNGQPAAYQ
ncbi:MAG: hypothetical protein AAFN11_16615, partial [Chloroflexota bacterium]